MPFVESLNSVTPSTSAVNSTTTLLTAGSTFTGLWEDCSKYSDLSVAVKTDQNGTYTVQFSPDGVNADSTLTRYYRTAQIEPPHIFEVTRDYCRITFTNTSASNQTYLRLQTKFDDRGQLNAPLDSVLAQDYDSVSVRPSDFRYEVALSRRQGATTWNKFGYNSDVDSAAPEVLAAFGGVFTILTSASTLTIASNSTDDDGDPVGIGARSILIYGIDANRVAATEIVTLNGTTNVVTATTWLGINRVVVYVAGSSLANVGLITITATTGGSTQATIPAGEGTTQQAIFFTQADHNFLMDYIAFNCEKTGGGASPKVRFKGWVYSVLTNCKYLVLNKLIDTAADGGVELHLTQPLIVGEKSCLYFEATTDTNDTFASCRFSGIEMRDVDA